MYVIILVLLVNFLTVSASPFGLCFHFSFRHNGFLHKTTRISPRVTTQRCRNWQRGMAIANAAMRCTKCWTGPYWSSCCHIKGLELLRLLLHVLVVMLLMLLWQERLEGHQRRGWQGRARILIMLLLLLHLRTLELVRGLLHEQVITLRQRAEGLIATRGAARCIMRWIACTSWHDMLKQRCCWLGPRKPLPTSWGTVKEVITFLDAASLLTIGSLLLTVEFLLTVDNFSFFTYCWRLFAYNLSFLTYNWSFFCLLTVGKCV